MSLYEIKNLDDFFKGEIVSVSIKPLTSAGDNYTSAIFSVDVVVKDGEQKHIRAVAKMLSKNEFIRRLFNSEKTFRNEVGYYVTIAPWVRRFQEEQGLVELYGCFPEIIGYRFNLEPSETTINEDAVLLLKNIRDDGYSTVDRKIGFDLAQTQLILDKMAELHASVFGLRVLKPEVFANELSEFFQEYNMYEAKEDAAKKLTDSIIDLLKEDDFCAGHLYKIRKNLENAMRNVLTKNQEVFQKGLFTSFVHQDMWTNNIMLKTVNDKPVDVKFVDYQIYELSSITRDVVFFLFSSVQLEILEQHCDTLISYYYNSFITWLQKLKCDVSNFTFESFLTEMGFFVQQTEFLHIMLMLRPIYAIDSDTKDVDNLRQDDFVHNKIGLDPQYKPKAYFIVREMIRRGWL